jgi:indolepyruvate ferredoxin oxidoreductase alpha subunit
MVPCLEPRNQQEAYDMAGEAFELSEQFHVPVLIRMVTRLSHARSSIKRGPQKQQKGRAKTDNKAGWMLLPAFARRNYAALIEKQKALEAWSEEHAVKNLELSVGAGPEGGSFALITAGLGGNYYEENLPDLIVRLGFAPPRLHIESYPLPLESIRRLCGAVPGGTAPGEALLKGRAGEILVIEEGQPFIEERLRGILPQGVRIRGRLGPDPALPRTGELDPDSVRAALGLPPAKSILDTLKRPLPGLPGRPPQLCVGCPHADSYEAIKRAAAELEKPGGMESARVSVNSDIGCYSLGALPPYSAIESIVCMGASIGMARGASDAGIPYAFAVIGDSTFYHSGITGLIDAAQANTPLTIIILDNSTVAMTGCQPAIVPSVKLRDLVLGCGVEPAHYAELDAKKQNLEENVLKLKGEAAYRGLSVVVFRRECLEAARKRRKAGAP